MVGRKSMKKINKTGMVLVAIYLLFVLGVYIYSIDCTWLFCQFWMFLIVSPWIFIGPVESLFNVIPESLFFLIFGLVNIVLLYFIGVGLSRLFGRWFKGVDASTLSDNNIQE
jgi:hypothetical protein